ncbi:MAG: hypothetical protein LBH10_06780, partial [Burkholderiaceae bacterium]|nr:hypothetical protein [Burkholderiaceae bacterium]
SPFQAPSKPLRSQEKEKEKEKEQERVLVAQPCADPQPREPLTDPPVAPPAAAPKNRVGTRLPDGWALPRPWGDWALGERADLSADDVRREAACFADYWHGKAGADARKADWEATWRNWIRRAKPALARSPPGLNRQEALEARNRDIVKKLLEKDEVIDV